MMENKENFEDDCTRVLYLSETDKSESEENLEDDCTRPFYPVYYPAEYWSQVAEYLDQYFADYYISDQTEEPDPRVVSYLGLYLDQFTVFDCICTTMSEEKLKDYIYAMIDADRRPALAARLDQTMTCSREFAEWLLEQSRTDWFEDEIWLNVILRYCNVGYRAVIREECRKGNDFYYHISLDGRTFSAQPTYELVRLRVGDPADEAHIMPVTDFCDRYSVLTTGAAFPGLQQYRGYEDFWDAGYLMDECIFQGNKAIEHLSGEPEMKALLSAPIRPRIEDCRKELISDDTFSYIEFLDACSHSFCDNQMPYSWGPMCPDRLCSINAYHNIVRAAALDCARICLDLGVSHRYPETFAVLLARQVLLTYAKSNKSHARGRRRLLALAEENYQAYIRKAEEKGRDPEEECGRVRIFLNCRVRTVMEPMTWEFAGHCRNIRGEALEHRVDCLGGYVSPQEKYADAWTLEDYGIF